MRQRGFVLLPVIIIILLIGVVGFSIYGNLRNKGNLNLFVTPNLTPSPITSNKSPIPTENPDISNKINLGRNTYVILESNQSGYKKFESKEAGFSFEYPNNFSIYDYAPEGRNMGRKIFICDQEIISRTDRHYQLCPSGMMIWYDGDGWGGGCEPEHHSSVLYNNKNIFICKSNAGFGGLYLNSAEHKFLIEGTYSTTFTPEVADKIIQSISIVNYRPREGE